MQNSRQVGRWGGCLSVSVRRGAGESNHLRYTQPTTIIKEAVRTRTIRRLLPPYPGIRIVRASDQRLFLFVKKQSKYRLTVKTTQVPNVACTASTKFISRINLVGNNCVVLAFE